MPNDSSICTSGRSMCQGAAAARVGWRAVGKSDVRQIRAACLCPARAAPARQAGRHGRWNPTEHAVENSAEGTHWQHSFGLYRSDWPACGACIPGDMTLSWTLSVSAVRRRARYTHSSCSLSLMGVGLGPHACISRYAANFCKLGSWLRAWATRSQPGWVCGAGTECSRCPSGGP